MSGFTFVSRRLSLFRVSAILAPSQARRCLSGVPAAAVARVRRRTNHGSQDNQL
jgi:hypothetical protein